MTSHPVQRASEVRVHRLTCVVVVVDGHRRRVIVTQHSLGGHTRVWRGGGGGGSGFGTSEQARVAEVDVEVLVLLEDVVVDHADGDLCESVSGF